MRLLRSDESMSTDSDIAAEFYSMQHSASDLFDQLGNEADDAQVFDSMLEGPSAELVDELFCERDPSDEDDAFCAAFSYREDHQCALSDLEPEPINEEEQEVALRAILANSSQECSSP